MSKDDLLFAIIGLLLGFVIGDKVTNYVNQKNSAPAPAAQAPGPEQPEETGPTEQELAQAQQAAQSQADNYDAQIAAGDIFFRAQRYDEAAGFFTKANRIKPDSIDPMMALGNVYFVAARETKANDKWPLAEKWYAAALAKDQSRVNIRTGLGLTFMLREPPNYDRAIQEYRKVLEVDAKHEKKREKRKGEERKKKNEKDGGRRGGGGGRVSPKSEALPILREEIAKLK